VNVVRSALAAAAIAALVLGGGLAGINPVSADIPLSSTSVTCAPTSIAVYTTTICTATATSSASYAYTGLFIWSASIQGSFTTGSAGPYPDSCEVTPQGVCSVTFIPLAYTSNPVTITAAYEYDTSHQQSTGTATISLTGGAVSVATSITIITATATTAITTVSTSTKTLAASVSVSDAAMLIILVGVLMITMFLVGEWRRTRHPLPHAAAPAPTR